MGAGPSAPEAPPLVALPPKGSLWERVFTVAPLVLVGTREGDGYDLAPKHMAMPLGWDGLYAFVCSPRHATYRNACRERAFTVSFPRAEHVVGVSLAASARREDGTKPGLEALKVFPATKVDGVLVEGCALYLECALVRVVDGFGDAVLVVGRVVAASAPEWALRSHDGDDAEIVHARGVLAFLAPGRFADVRESRSFPFSVDFAR
jgi:flavin reductase (DIM6/NTAB) family NADH-FMN oxidoreductase RutF